MSRYCVRVEQEGFITGFLGNGRVKPPGTGTRYPHPSSAIRAADDYRRRHKRRLTQLLIIDSRDGSIVARR